MARNRAKRKTLLLQVKENLDSKLAIGQSKKADKIQYLKDENGKLIKDESGNKIVIQKDLTKEKIYSWRTYNAYLNDANRFAQWCKENHNCKTLKQCRHYVDEYIQSMIDNNLSAWTIKKYVCAIAKLYNCTSNDFMKTPARQRKNIKRSRGTAVRDKHFSLKNNEELINFCCCTGLRRAELEQLRGTDLREIDGKFYLNTHVNTKGGRERLNIIAGTEEQVKRVVDRMRASGNEKVWEKVHSHADIHSYRAEYCNRLYNNYKRDKEDISNWHEIYYCRGDLAGAWYDKKAMRLASNGLGHNRINVIASNYLRAT